MKTSKLLMLILILIILMVMGCAPEPGNKLKKSDYNTDYNKWIAYEIPGILSFKGPPSMELQAGSSKGLVDAMKQGAGIKIDADEIVLQPKGCNDMDLDALRKYCRIIVKTEHGPNGTYLGLWDDFTPTHEEMTAYENELRRGIPRETGVTILNWYPAKIIKINGVDILKVSYLRTATDGKPIVSTSYTIQNNSMLHAVSVSYRESEKNLWEHDMGRLINTFKFIEN